MLRQIILTLAAIILFLLIVSCTIIMIAAIGLVKTIFVFIGIILFFAIIEWSL